MPASLRAIGLDQPASRPRERRPDRALREAEGLGDFIVVESFGLEKQRLAVPLGQRGERRLHCTDIVGSFDDLVRRGLLERYGERRVLTTDGRLLADAVVRDLLP